MKILKKNNGWQISGTRAGNRFLEDRQTGTRVEDNFPGGMCGKMFDAGFELVLWLTLEWG